MEFEILDVVFRKHSCKVKSSSQQQQKQYFVKTKYRDAANVKHNPDPNAENKIKIVMNLNPKASPNKVAANLDPKTVLLLIISSFVNTKKYAMLQPRYIIVTIEIPPTIANGMLRVGFFNSPIELDKLAQPSKQKHI